MSEKFTLKAWRNIRGLSQQDVADRLGVTRQTVVIWENDDWKPKGVVVHALAYLYETEVDHIKV